MISPALGDVTEVSTGSDAVAPSASVSVVTVPPLPAAPLAISSPSVRVPGSVSRPGPGKPPTMFTAGAEVGGMQNTDPSVGSALFPTGGSATPGAEIVPPTTPLSRKQSRKKALQESPGAGQSAGARHEWCVWIAQWVSIGPLGHFPSPPPAAPQSDSLATVAVSSMHLFGAVGSPVLLLPQKPPGQSPLSSQSCPGLVLPLLQVSQKHFLPLYPLARQLGLLAVSVFTFAPVERSRPDGTRLPIRAPAVGGQSKLTGPKTGLVPLVVHAKPCRWPPLQTPATHCGHGWSRLGLE